MEGGEAETRQTLVVAAPFQGQLFLTVNDLRPERLGIMYKYMLKYRKRQQNVVDKRVTTLQRVIQNIRAVKLYAYEAFFDDKVSCLRQQEIASLRRYGVLWASVTGSFSFIPILSSVCAYKVCGVCGSGADAQDSDVHSLRMDRARSQPSRDLFFATAVSRLEWPDQLDAVTLLGIPRRPIRST